MFLLCLYESQVFKAFKKLCMDSFGGPIYLLEWTHLREQVNFAEEVYLRAA